MDDEVTPDRGARRDAESAREAEGARAAEAGPHAAQREAAEATQHAAEVTPREAERAQREAEKLRRDRERAAERARRDAEKADAQRRRDEQQRERDRARAERETQRAVDEAAREAAAASREAARAAAEAERAERRAAHHAERAHARARSLEPEPDGPRLPREIAVLWRRQAPARRGPRPGLTLDDIADAGVAIADAEGIDAVSMARIAAELGYTAMSLYRYVASKDEVIALMVDRVVGEPPATDPAAGWRERLGAVARAQVPVLLAHPWMTTTGSVVNTFGPNRLGWMEALVGALDGTPLSAAEKFVVAGALGNQALADVRTFVDVAEFTRRAAERGESSGYELLGEALVDPAVHPALAAAIAEGGLTDEPTDPLPDLTSGLELILDGVAARIERAR